MSRDKARVLKICDKLHQVYGNDPVAWVHDNINFDGLKFKGLTDQQQEFLTALVTNKRVCVSAGGGIGKSAGAALGNLWFTSCHPYAKVPTTAPTGSQLRDVLWAEIAMWHSRCKLKDLFVLTTERLHIKHFREWFSVARTVPKDNKLLNDTMAGFHAPWLLAIVDEASGVPDAVFTAIEGAMTNPNCFVLMISNPVSTGGYYYDTINDPEGKGRRFKIFFYDARKSPLVDADYEQTIIERFGKNHPMYIAKVLGQPISELLTTVCSPQLFDKLITENRFDCDGTNVVGIDVGGPKDPSICCFKRGNAVYKWERHEGRDSQWLYDHLLTVFRENPRTRFIIDAVGIGAGLYSFLANTPGLDVTPFYGNKRPTIYNADRSKKGKQRQDELQIQFLNNRTMGYEHLQRTITNIQWVATPPPELKKQLANLKFKFESGKPIEMEPKVLFKRRLGMSPDEADALMLANFIDAFSVRSDVIIPMPKKIITSLVKPKGPSIGSKFNIFI